MSVRVAVAVSTAFVSLAACVSPPEDATETQAVVERVHELRCDGCDGPELLGGVVSLAVSSSGSVVVIDRYPPFVRVWSSSGELQAWFAREGQGPGEMLSPDYLAIHDVETLSMVDHRNSFWTIFTMDGQLFQTHRLAGQPRFATFSAAGNALVYTTRPAGRCSFPDVMKTNAIDGSTTRLTTLAELPTGEADGCPKRVYSFDVHPEGGFALGFGSPDYLLREHGPDGALVREIRPTSERAPKTEEELEQERIRTQQGRLGGVYNDIELAHDHFYGDAIRYDDGGRLWVRTPRGRRDLETVFDVFRSGERITSVAVPAPTPLLGRTFDIGGDYLLLLGEDESTNPMLTLFRIEWQ